MEHKGRGLNDNSMRQELEQLEARIAAVLDPDCPLNARARQLVYDNLKAQYMFVLHEGARFQAHLRSQPT